MKPIIFVFMGLAVLSQAQASTIVNFDDLGIEALTVPDGYGGINWLQNWTSFGTAQDPYTPHSVPNRVYDFLAEAQFSFLSPTLFEGAWFAGFEPAEVSFNLYLNNTLVGTSFTLGVSDTPTFLASGYSGMVNKVGVVSNAPDFFVMDDVTYGGTSAVPEPNDLILVGAGILTILLVRRRDRSRRPSGI